MKTYNFRDYRSIRKLIELKRRRQETVGVALPVHNESSTLGDVIKTVQSCRRLVDDLVVIDTNSRDGSRALCRKIGVRLVRDFDVAKDLNLKLRRGKGWNLWSSLYYLDTDIIVWMDTDIKTFHRGYILGLIGPLLENQRLKFIKGFYKKTGRTSEMTARPLISILFPQLKELVQPLAGEYGGRREFLEQLTFYSGYSVEIATILQAYFNLKPSEFAQVDLGKYTHKHQDTLELSSMSASIMYTFFKILQEQDLIKTKRLSSYLYRRFIKGVGKLEMDKKLIADYRLPPMISLKKYQNKFSKRSPG